MRPLVDPARIDPLRWRLQRALCALLGHRWRPCRDTFCQEFIGEHADDCARCGCVRR